MALRVLLADESSSIKKVMQLALQDFGVEVKAVPVGLDVIPVCRSWTPDIIFADVLLTKRSGYEVSADLKADPQLSKIPVVLMWSGFMDVDQAKTKASRADRGLEKPFDADALRGLVRELVPATGGNAIANFLSFPKLPDFVEATPAAQAPTPTAPLEQKASAGVTPTSPATTTSTKPQYKPEVPAPQFPPAPPAAEPTAYNAQELPVFEVDEPEDFTQIPLPKSKPAPIGSNTTGETENWATGNLDRFKIQLPQDDFGYDEVRMQNIDDAPIEMLGGGEVALASIDGEDFGRTPAQQPAKPQIHSPTFSGVDRRSSTAQIDPAQMEQLVREQVRSVLQDIAWKIIPDIAERIVREEIQKLLKEADKL